MRDLGAKDRVELSVAPMEDIPVGGNPFYYDFSSMGSQLVRGWWAMHSGYDREDDPRALEFLYLVNSRTGQRFRLVIKPETDQEYQQQAELLSAEAAVLAQALNKQG